MWQYSQSTGVLTHEGIYVAKGYSGTGAGRNNPDMQDVPRVGPIPRGKWKIMRAYDHPKLGPVVMNLNEDGEFTRRDLFRIHGDNSQHDASLGCIILPRHVRQQIDASNDKYIEVVR